MSNDVIANYITEARSMGFSDDRISDVLTQVGWPADVVTDHLNAMPGGVTYDKQKMRRAIDRWLLRIFRTQIGAIVILAIFGILSSGLGLLQPWPMKIAADSVFGEIPAPSFLASYTGTQTLLIIVAVSIITLYILREVLEIVSQLVRERLVYKLDTAVKSSFFIHVLRLPLAYKKKLQSGDYVFRQNDESGEVAQIVLDTPQGIFVDIFSIIMALVVIIKLDAGLSLVSLTVVPILIFSGKYFSKKMEQLTTKIQEASSKMYAYTNESIANVALVQAFGKINVQATMLEQLMAVAYRLRLKSVVLIEAMGVASGGVVTMATTATLLVGGNQIFKGNLTFGELLVLINYLSNFYSPVQSLISKIANFRQSYAVVERVYEVLDDHKEIELDDQRGVALRQFTNEIRFDNVTIKHESSPQLNGVNFVVKQGMKVGIIGSSGSGKSTLLGSLTRNNPHDGSITIDGQEIMDINLGELRRLFSVVGQQPQLFSDSVANNIAYGVDFEPTREQLVWAAQSAGAHDFILQLPKQYDTNVGEAGAFLSGGQLQRISIARAFLRNAPILLLDEPTSALDVQSEKHIIESIQTLMKDKTVFVVSHKLSLLVDMDVVLVVESGKVIDVNAYGGLERYIQYLHAHELV